MCGALPPINASLNAGTRSARVMNWVLKEGRSEVSQRRKRVSIMQIGQSTRYQVHHSKGSAGKRWRLTSFRARKASLGAKRAAH